MNWVCHRKAEMTSIFCLGAIHVSLESNLIIKSGFIQISCLLVQNIPC